MCEMRTVTISKYHFKLSFLHLFVVFVIHERNLVRRELAYHKNTGNGEVRGRSKNRDQKEERKKHER